MRLGEEGKLTPCYLGMLVDSEPLIHREGSGLYYNPIRMFEKTKNSHDSFFTSKAFPSTSSEMAFPLKVRCISELEVLVYQLLFSPLLPPSPPFYCCSSIFQSLSLSFKNSK